MTDLAKTSLCPTCLNTGVNYREYEGVREIDGPCRTCGGKQTHVFAVSDSLTPWNEIASLCYEGGYTFPQQAQSDARELLFGYRQPPKFLPSVFSLGYHHP